jgi:hypothetical protein
LGGWRLGVQLEFEIRASHLQSRCSTAWSIPPIHFALLILEMGSHELFAQGWPETRISASQVARITSMSYWHPV